MTIYTLLLIYILACAWAVFSLKIDIKKRETAYLTCVFFAILAIFSLRSSSVGIDVEGYERVYELCGNYDWFDFGYVYFENGYILLMKTCSALGLSFQGFLTVVSVLTLVPIFVFIKKYSKNVFFSVIIYVCYMCFEFDLTGLRQAIAMSLVLIAYMVLMDSKRLGWLKFIPIVFIAGFFHRGVYVAFLILPFIKRRSIAGFLLTFVPISIFALLFKDGLSQIIVDLTGLEIVHENAAYYIGMNTVFLIGCCILFTLACVNSEREDKNEEDDPKQRPDNTTHILTKLFILGTVISIFFGSDTSARSFMVPAQAIFVLLPNAIESVFSKRTRISVYVALTAFFIIFFYTNSLIPNTFEIVPYKFFWEPI